MYLKSFQMTNFRKYREKDNTFTFVNAAGIKEKKDDRINVASATTLIVGKNNAGKTSVIQALLKLIRNNESNKLQIKDMNFHYLKECFQQYSQLFKEAKIKENIKFKAPFMEFVLTIAFEKDSDDLVTNLVPFMLLKDVDQDKLEILLRFEVSEDKEFQDAMLKALKQIEDNVQKRQQSNDVPEESDFQILLKELEKVKFQLNYYQRHKEEGQEEFQLNKVENRFKLLDIIDIKCISANNVKKDEILSEAFNKIITYRYEKIIADKKEQLDKKIRELNSSLTKSIKEHHSDDINAAVSKIVASETMKVDLSSDITEEKLVRNLLRYEYVEKGMNIPEGQFGLGYTHLVMIIAELIDYMEHYPDDKQNSKINLIAIEEPESFMHPQMQELFIKNINEALEELVTTKQKKLNSQLMVTTHSSHILNSKIQMGNSFDDISYVYEEDGRACVVNLDNESIMPDTDDREKDFAFLKKHIKYKVSELFFADAVILVEGFAEETILPYYLDKEEELNKRYISIFGINGAHAFLYEKLLKKLKVPALIITDLDIQRKKTDNEEKDQQAAVKYPQIEDLKEQKTTNKTIKHFHKTDDISSLEPYMEEENIYIAYQWKTEQYYPTSFEEAFILSNADNEMLNSVLEGVKPGIYKEIVKINGKVHYEQNIKRSYEWQQKLSDEKGKFASELLYILITADDSAKRPRLPEYIENGLKWMIEKLG